ncbi:MAG TPA: ATP-binding cassette domain-containing protein, partial [Nitrospiraceae bacterium]|nr:ATP-binding cassette domain-containing protein [Nitrospiraceae bacterium]
MAEQSSFQNSIIYLDGVTVDYDGFKALNNLTFMVNFKELRVVIGPNGAGKTTLLDVICGKTKPASGRVVFGADTELIGKQADEIVKLGIGRKFQAPSIYGNLTVWENLDLSLKRKSKGVFPTLLGKSTAEERERIAHNLETINLKDYAHTRAGSL